MGQTTMDEIREIIFRVKAGEEFFSMGDYFVFVPFTEPTNDYLKAVHQHLSLGRPTTTGKAFAHLIPTDSPEVLDAFEQEYGIIPAKEFISFNPYSFNSKEALEFVVAHEVGHIVMGHVKKFHNAVEFTDEEFIQKELEADAFAVGITGHVSTALNELHRFHLDELPPLRKREKALRIQQLEAML